MPDYFALPFDLSSRAALSGSPVITTWTGRSVHLLDPRPASIDIRDIAHALANQCRFNGHTAFYSVADHSIRVATHLPAPLRLLGLLHDATDAYLGAASPLKLHSPAYGVLHDAVWLAIATRFGLPDELPAAVRFTERVLHLTEVRDLVTPGERPVLTCDGLAPLVETIHPLPPAEAEAVFLYLFERYSAGRQATAPETLGGVTSRPAGVLTAASVSEPQPLEIDKESR